MVGRHAGQRRERRLHGCDPDFRADEAMIYPDRREAGRERLHGLLRVRHAAAGSLLSEILRFPGGLRHDSTIDEWFASRGALGAVARTWFEVMRACGDDVRELLHDGHPTACLGDAAFGYTNVFTSHVNVGFFRGAELDDPHGILEGTGRFMRHVKITPETEIDETTLTEMIDRAYADMKRREQQ